MRWLALPEKREIALVLISLVVYFVAYNFEMSVEFLGIDPVATHRMVFGGLGFKTLIGKDGRKPPGWRDALETDVYGDWNWDEGHTASESQLKVDGKYPSWARKDADEGGQLDLTVNDALQRWERDIPQTRLLKHAPGSYSFQDSNLVKFTIRLGYTILDNLFIFNDSVYLVSDDEHLLPPMSSILASKGPGFRDCTVLSLEKARGILGSYGSTYVALI